MLHQRQHPYLKIKFKELILWLKFLLAYPGQSKERLYVNFKTRENEFDIDIEYERIESRTKYQYSLCDEKNSDFSHPEVKFYYQLLIDCGHDENLISGNVAKKLETRKEV